MTKPRPTDEEFAELARQRDEAIHAIAKAAFIKLGGDPNQEPVYHVSGAGKCYCACPEGPCQHIWDGPEYTEDNCSSVTCSRCGTPAIYHDLRCAP